MDHLEVPGSSLIFVNEIEDFEARILDGAPAVVTLAEKPSDRGDARGTVRVGGIEDLRS